MIRLGNHIRLTPREVARFTQITGFAPDDVKTIEDLDAYIAHCKHYYWGVPEATRFLHWLIDREYCLCCLVV